MKTIVIRPEVITYHTSAFREPRQPLSKGLLVALVLLPVVGGLSWLGGRTTATPPTEAASLPPVALAPAPVARLPIPTPAPLVAADGTVELRTGVERGVIRAEFTGNGRDRLEAELSNPSTERLVVRLSFGQVFTSGRNSVVVTRNTQITLGPGETGSLTVPVAAARSTNRFTASNYSLSNRTIPKIDLLLTYAQDHPELSAAALQTAILAQLENLPLSSLCKFTAAGSDLPTRFDTTPFRAETADLLSALLALREIGVRDREIALTIDPQLKVEAMIDPVCRSLAMSYYGIAADQEWSFWKTHLLQGDPATRHYALYGIARFYPEIALEMLPKWAREKRTTPIFRLTAVQALAETNRPEALAMLTQLESELGRNTELGRAAADAAQLLASTLSRPTDPQRAVAFRGSLGAAPF